MMPASVLRRCRWLPLVAATLALLAGCALFSAKSNNDRSLLDVIEHFRQSGLQIDEIQPTIYTAVLADDGCALFIEGAKVEVYRFDLNVPKIRQRVERVAKSGQITIFGIDFPAEVNGSFIMLTYSQHPKVPDIIEVFDRF
jgi:hypothetical protein